MRRFLLLGSAAALSASLLGVDRAVAQTSDAEAIRAANTAFYAALSARDLSAVERVWLHEGQVFNIFGASRVPLTGWAAIRRGYEDLFSRFPELNVSMPEPTIRQDGTVALVVGVESLRGRAPSGEAVSLSLPTTNVFVREGGRWLMVHHHSSRPPA